MNELSCVHQPCTFATHHTEMMSKHLTAHGGSMFPTLRQAREVHAHDLIPAVQAWDHHSEAIRELIIKKSAAYGNAWERQGYMGNLARVLSKAARLENMVWQDYTPENEGQEEPGGESVLDTLQDLAALTAFFVANLDGGNRWGR